MSSPPVNFDSGHSGMVHDAQLDYYGRRLATCSSDSTIKLFDVVGEQHTHLADLTGHEGPVWQVAWAHPSFGSLLASCSFDHQVIVWKEVSDNQWVQVYRSPANLHTASVNSIAWAPYETGLILACASSDGSFSIITYQKDGSWEATKQDNAHAMGCTAISWAPYTVLSATKSGAVIPKRLVTSGCDNLAKVWSTSGSTWQLEGELKGHTDWVRDVSWAPSDGRLDFVIASAGQDGKVTVWTEEVSGPQAWKSTVIHTASAPIWRVSWSTTGSILAATEGSGQVSLWKQALDGAWQQL